MTGPVGNGSKPVLLPEDLAFRARALAQAHPLSPAATSSLNTEVHEQRASQPIAEIGDWAGAAIVTGYCLRRVEEVAIVVHPVGRGDQRVDAEKPEAIDTDLVARIASGLRRGKAAQWLLVDEAVTVAALDRIIASEIDKRRDNWRDAVTDAAWGELEEYLAWWVVKGYAMRVAEMATGR
ncbi:MAG: hypothetical protein ACYCV7_14800 [Acidimicrobiales bacterium]